MVRAIPVFLRDLIMRIQRHDVSGLAAQLAFFFLLSLFPLLIFLMTLLPFIQLSQEDLLGVIRHFAPGETMQLIESNLNDIMSSQNGKLLSFGIIATLWSASNGINAIVRALNKAYDVAENRPFLLARGMAIVLTFLMIFVFIIALLLQVFGREIGAFLFTSLGLSEQYLSIWSTIRLLASSLIPFLVFTVLYWVAPNKKLSMFSAIPGAVFSTIGWAVSSLAFSYYVSNFGHYSTTYGSIGAIIVLMIWFYLSGIIIIIGGEINALITLKNKEKNFAS
ncbi:YihY/virulence factor BrkB family protein [Bacillus aquiflavi]|uniref:YihY/virulence factor BrkB family protein n=1 Tax=Bacillus aquiflavi TaxID=2672567 RepID=A0A6B3W0L5_9BACI|nr:YihY/virulence factor BrkB family protein [Bacillus aquiflavi]MBA4536747.1 YihY/virulence factor BrkB family protein [Bacillus aquiflavi]NEY81114.1 YihY/virulence factor BrkB family protein [Bacillus aquiflavi]